MRLVIIEDDAQIAEVVGLCFDLRWPDAEVMPASDGLKGIDLVEMESPDIVILDIGLPDIDGFEVCRRIRATGSTVPILFLTAKSSDADRLLGLKVGADDYIPKPFLLEELILRIQGIFRRQEWYSSGAKEQETLSFGDATINFRTYEATTGDRTVKLTEKECMLMRLLVERSGEVVSREEILERVWGYRFSTSSRTIDNFIVRLRRYFEDDPKNPDHIHSVRGVGYRFTP